MNENVKRGNIFKKFLEENNCYIDYNGIDYTLATKEGNVLSIAKTGDEVYNFILGYTLAVQEANKIIAGLKETNEELVKQNETNITNYEKILASSGQSLIQDNQSLEK